MITIPIAYSSSGITLDEARVLPDGSIWIYGWSLATNIDAIDVLRSGVRCARVDSYRTYRPDVSAALADGEHFRGFEAVFAAPANATDDPFEIRIDERCIHRGSAPASLGTPHYAKLVDSEQVYHRDDIYGSGPPMPGAAEDIIALGAVLQGRVLDFGCGAGFLVACLRERGIDASGIELDRPAIRDSLLPAVADHVLLYDGTFPLPYADASFDGAIATEVIEHIADYAGAVAELARVTRERLIVTVPDASAIPRLFHANVVPWHLLESTHVNFFNARSLRATLATHFRSIRMLKIGTNHTNGIPWSTSLVAICEK